MKQKIQKLIQTSVDQLKAQAILPGDVTPQIIVEHTRDKAHGDFASNVAMMLAKPAKRNPRELAELIIKNLPDDSLIKKVDIAGPGFINFFIVEGAQLEIINTILTQGEQFGRSNVGAGKRAHIEFVSANPTGPLHVGHGRGAAYGATLSDLLEAIGYDVHREYYVNDAGRQMNILAVSVWLRYLALHGEKFTFPVNGYKGEYVIGIAEKLKQQEGGNLVRPADEVFADVPADETPDGKGDKEAHIDAIILNARKLLAERYETLFQSGLKDILDGIKKDLHEFGVDYQTWFLESRLMDNGAVQHGLDRLEELGYLYKKDGATWFKSSEFGDEKDRVLVREDGRTTYFASDVAYHLQKIESGYDLIIDVLGSDHHGYVPRVRAAMRALGVDEQHFIAPLVQFAVLYRSGEKVQMSTRSGSFVTLKELFEEIGKDAARFFYVMRKVEQHMDFDLDLAKSKSNENPVYYIQYAHARMCSVMRQLAEKKWTYNQALGLANLDLLDNEHEKAVLTELSKYPEMLETAAIHYEPHSLVHYLRELATSFHSYYNASQFLVDDEKLRNARLCLVNATKQVIANGLSLLSVSTPEKM